MGLCLAQLGCKAQALAEFDRALEINRSMAGHDESRCRRTYEEGISLQSARFKRIEYSKEQVLGRSK